MAWKNTVLNSASEGKGKAKNVSQVPAGIKGCWAAGRRGWGWAAG
jgi:hypothetical protein